MGKKSSPPPPPQQIDAGQATGEYLFGGAFPAFKGITDERLQNRLLRSEEQFRPQYTELELGDIATLTRGTKNFPGLFDLLSESSDRAFTLQQEQLAQQREADIGALEEFSPQAVEALREADPFSTQIANVQRHRAIDLARKEPSEAEALLGERGLEFISSAGELSPLEKRQFTQEARSSSLARGREFDRSGFYHELQARMAEELSKRERDVALGGQLLGQQAGLGQIRENQAQQAIGQAFGQNRMLAGDLGQVILGRPSSAIGLGQQTLGQATGLAGQPVGPQLFDPNVGINIALQNQANQAAYGGAVNQADAARFAGILGAGGQIGAAAAPALIAMCWVAREVYGEQNPKWRMFRDWVLYKSPRWFRKAYLRYGEGFAEFISNKPKIKGVIREWMDSIIEKNYTAYTGTTEGVDIHINAPLCRNGTTATTEGIELIPQSFEDALKEAEETWHLELEHK